MAVSHGITCARNNTLRAPKLYNGSKPYPWLTKKKMQIHDSAAKGMIHEA